MSHRNARTTVQGRLLIVQRHRDGWPQSHIAKAMGISRKCVKKWLDRYAVDGETGLFDRSSRPHRCPRRTSGAVERHVIDLRQRTRRGPDWLGAELGMPARTVSRVLARNNVPKLCVLDPITGEVIKASKATAQRYERERPGELVHMDVKKIGRIPDGGGWRAHGRRAGSILRDRSTTVGFDDVHSLVDDHSRLAYSEILPDEKGTTCASFLERAVGSFAAHGITRIERLMTRQRLGLPMVTPSHLRRTRDPATVHQTPLPLAERKGRKAQPDPAGRMGLPSDLHQQRRAGCGTCTLARVLQHSTPPQRTQRAAPNQPTATNVLTRYN